MNNPVPKVCVCVTTLVLVAFLAGYTGSVSAAQDKQQESGDAAAIGAVGAIVSSLVFPDDAGDAAPQNDAQPANEDQLKESLGEKAVRSLEALTHCKHDVAFTYAREASASSNPDYELAGLWLEALTEADRKNWFEAKAYFPKIRNNDQDIQSQADFDAALSKASKEISGARQEYGSGKSCKR